MDILDVSNKLVVEPSYIKLLHTYITELQKENKLLSKRIAKLEKAKAPAKADVVDTVSNEGSGFGILIGVE